MSQGEVFSQHLDPNFYFEWTDKVNRSFALYMATEDKNNLSMFESIFFDEEENRIWALPMSDNAGQNNYHIMARGFGDNITSYPYEVLVMPNINIPNHKILLHFEYNYILFEAYLPYRLELLRLLSVIMGDGGSFENLTLDSYENTTTNETSRMLIRISNSTIGYKPCNESQMGQILNAYGKLSTGVDNEPHPHVANILELYNLVKVELELIGPCAAYGALENEEDSVLSSLWFKIGFAIVLAIIVTAAAVTTVVCLCKHRKLRSAVSVKKTNSTSLTKNSKQPTADSTFFAVKSKHVPVIFADEYDEPSSVNQISAASPLILKNEKPPAKDLGSMKQIMNGSLNHSPMNGPTDFNNFSFDTLAPNGAGSLSSCMLNNTCPGSAILYANSQCSTVVSHRYCPSQYRPPPPYKPPAKAIVPS